MKTLLAFLVLACSFCYAQGWPQPVREAEHPARGAVSATCAISWTAAEGFRSCDAYTVPAGRTLALRSVSLLCNGRSADAFSNVVVTAGAPRLLFVPLENGGTLPGGRVTHAAAVPAYLHVPAGGVLNVSASFSGLATSLNPPYCTVSVQGFLAYP